MERRIVIGLITNSDYLRQIKEEWKAEYIESQAARTLATWCWDYFDLYDKAPNKDIGNILIKKLRKKKIKKDLAEEIETDILPDLSKQYEEESQEDLKTLLDDTREYFVERQLELLRDTLSTHLDKGETNEAKKIVDDFILIEGNEDDALDFGDEAEVDKAIDEAFDDTQQKVLKFEDALGDFWNDEFYRGAFISILAPEKRGKTFTLLEIANTAYDYGSKVGFIQAGDMTKGQQLVRTSVYLTKKSNKSKFCGKQYIPVPDCIKNQTDTCNKKIRACKFGLFEADRVETLRDTITYEELLETKQNNKFYKNCYNCLKWKQKKWGTVWLEEFNNGDSPLTAKEAKEAFKKYFYGNKNKLKLATYSNGELTINKLKSILENWKRQGFVPDILLVDYADLLVSTAKMETRHQIDFIWRNLRGIAQKYNLCLVSPTQADAKSYILYLLTVSNFSEDKRKLAHVTAMYGLNQSPDGREKKLGIMRYNKIVVREDEFHETDQVTVLHKFQIGRPNLGSFL